MAVVIFAHIYFQLTVSPIFPLHPLHHYYLLSPSGASLGHRGGGGASGGNPLNKEVTMHGLYSETQVHSSPFLPIHSSLCLPPYAQIHIYITPCIIIIHFYTLQVHSSPVVGIRESPNENTLLLSLYSFLSPLVLLLSPLFILVLQVHSSPVVGIRESPNENTLITVGEDGSIFVFHLNKPSGIEAGGAGIITISVIELFTPPTFRHLSSSTNQ